jgi:uncharacterized protein with von Willebrand factor type A (vWA) domain
VGKPAAAVTPTEAVVPAVAGAALVEAEARRIAFVVDASGSMLNRFDAVRTVIERAVTDLRPPQAFNCVVFAADAPVAFQRALVVATDSNKLTFGGYLKRLWAHGESDPTAAFEAAFAQRPDAVYLISDGDFPNNADVLREIRRLNASRRAKVYTVCVTNGGVGNERFLRQVAEENGGTSRVLSESGLGPAR